MDWGVRKQVRPTGTLVGDVKPLSEPLSGKVRRKTAIQGALKIEKGVPLPQIQGRSGSVVRDALKAMKVGDSFLAPERPDTAYLYAKQLKIEVATRKVEGGFRVWRTK